MPSNAMSAAKQRPRSHRTDQRRFHHCGTGAMRRSLSLTTRHRLAATPIFICVSSPSGQTSGIFEKSISSFIIQVWPAILVSLRRLRRPGRIFFPLFKGVCSKNDPWYRDVHRLSNLLFTANASQADDKAEVSAADERRSIKPLNKLFTGDTGPMKDIWSRAKDVRTWALGAGFRWAGPRSKQNGTPRQPESSAAKSSRSNCTSPSPRRSPSSGATRRGRTSLMARRSRFRSVRPPYFAKRMVRGK